MARRRAAMSDTTDNTTFTNGTETTPMRRKNSETALAFARLPSEPARTTIPVLNAGANRGAELMQSAIASWNAESERAVIEPRYIDPIPERAKAMVVKAKARGITATGIEAKIETVLGSDGEQTPAPVLFNIDRPQAIASGLMVAADRGRALLGYLLLRMPGGDLVGLRTVIESGDERTKREGARFFERLGLVTARAGSSFVVGSRGDPAHAAVEPVYRDWFARHMRENLTKIAAGLEPEASPFELTHDGRTTYPLHFELSEAGWSDPIDLARRVAMNPSTPLVRGGNFVVGEIGPDGIRFHEVRLRVTDGRLALRGSAAFDLAAIEAERVVMEQRARDLAEALARAERETLLRTRPVFTTD